MRVTLSSSGLNKMWDGNHPFPEWYRRSAKEEHITSYARSAKEEHITRQGDWVSTWSKVFRKSVWRTLSAIVRSTGSPISIIAPLPSVTIVGSTGEPLSVIAPLPCLTLVLDSCSWPADQKRSSWFHFPPFCCVNTGIVCLSKEIKQEQPLSLGSDFSDLTSGSAPCAKWSSWNWFCDRIQVNKVSCGTAISRSSQLTLSRIYRIPAHTEEQAGAPHCLTAEAFHVPGKVVLATRFAIPISCNRKQVLFEKIWSVVGSGSRHVQNGSTRSPKCCIGNSFPKGSVIESLDPARSQVNYELLTMTIHALCSFVSSRLHDTLARLGFLKKLYGCSSLFFHKSRLNFFLRRLELIIACTPTWSKIFCLAAVRTKAPRCWCCCSISPIRIL